MDFVKVTDVVVLLIILAGIPFLRYCLFQCIRRDMMLICPIVGDGDSDHLGECHRGQLSVF